MSVTLGINPIGWTNDCMPWLGDFISLDTCLAEAKAAGFSGVELGRKFPRSTKALGPILKRHGLALVSGWYSANLLERDAKTEIAAMKDHLALLRGLGAKVMVFAETTGEIINQVGAPISRRPVIKSAAEWKRLGSRFTEVAAYMSDQGIQMAVHHHMGTVIESPQDVDRLLDNSGDAVGLLLDTGHMTFAGGDPIAVARKYASRIKHVHCKDIRRYALAACRQRDVSFSEAVLCGIFTAPGDGLVDFKGVFDILAKAKYSGWLVQEAEQDPRIAHPASYAALGRAHLAQLCAGAKMKLAA
ncbi:myo-inosose-2 dehydratase [Dongia deserti]|uniref:myo-inosose-2 dehydratase n=1 Tax=Dongia deserti TaxID=2268030 RepID=UPI000E65AA75|nr:myo-inosose-2 dehydratase [Dongia deserti]